MAVEIPQENESQSKDIDILWVNNMRTFKRPELAIEIAKKFPQYRVKMIGGPCFGYIPYYKKIKKEAKKISNLHFVGPVPYSLVNRYFKRSKLLINTSHTEGFPNSYLQAWIRAVPVVTFFDPDDTIKTNNLGKVASSLVEMEKYIDYFLSDERKRAQTGEKAKQFVIKNYSPDKVVDDYINLLEELEY
jgi:glycosyltransferase involved in cell wall biosynthesis